MSENFPSENLFADDPITSINQDRLNRDLFARQVSEVCKKVADKSSSSVVALVGSWGSGKSSILNLIANQLRDEEWFVAEFNPWLISDVDSLLRAFFDEIIHVTPSDKNKNLRKEIGSYVKKLSPLGKLGGLAGVDGSAILHSAGQLLEGDQSLTKQRDTLIKELTELKKPIFVMLDDLDRLHPQELLMIFKLVRLVGRLPNLYYLLSYDEKTLLDVISQTDLSRGDRIRARSYLEKIVQVKLDLPKMSTNQQLELVNTAHGEVLQRNNITMHDEDLKRVNAAFAECMSSYLNHPRAIKRFFAQIDALYPLVKNEVNFADFTLLTFLRTFEPSVHQLIIERRQELTSKYFLAGSQSEKLPERRLQWMELLKSTEVKDATKIFNLLSHLFTYIKSARYNTDYSYTNDNEKLNKRVGNTDYFDRYFVFGVPEDDISDTEILDLVKQLSTSEGAITALESLIDKNPILTLRKLSNVQEILDVPPQPLLKLLGNKYLELKSEEFLTVPPQLVVHSMVKHAMSQITINDRREIVTQLTLSLSGLLMLVNTYPVRDDENEESLEGDLNNIIVESIKVKMEGLGQKKLEQFSESEYKLLQPYRLIVGTDVFRSWLWAGVTKQGWDPITLLANLIGDAISFGSGEVKRSVGRIDNDILENYFGLEQLLQHTESEVKGFVPEGQFDHSEDPTFENRRNHVLWLLKNKLDASREEAN